MTRIRNRKDLQALTQMSNMIVKDKELLKRVLSRESYPERAINFISSFYREHTPQGSTYWEEKYYRLYEIDQDTQLTFRKTEMLEKDWKYLESLVRETPKDPFLLAKTNREYLDD